MRTARHPALLLLALFVLLTIPGCQSPGPVAVSAAEINLSSGALGKDFNQTAEDLYNPAMPPEVLDYNQRIFASSKATVYARVVIYEQVNDAEKLVELHRDSLEAELVEGMGDALQGFDQPEIIPLGGYAILKEIRLSRMEGHFLIWADRNVVFEIVSIGRFGAVSSEKIQDFAKVALGRIK